MKSLSHNKEITRRGSIICSRPCAQGGFFYFIHVQKIVKKWVTWTKSRMDEQQSSAERALWRSSRCLLCGSYAELVPFFNDFSTSCLQNLLSVMCAPFVGRFNFRC